MFEKVLAAVLLVLSLPVFGGETFRLNVDISNSQKEKMQEVHTWYVEGDKFRLKITGGGRVVNYIFTGRSLLSCLKVKDAALIKTDAVHKDLRQAIKRGLCIVSPINIMTSFFISPLHSLSFVETDESMKSSLKLIAASASVPKNKLIAGIDCQAFERQFSFESKGKHVVEGKIAGCYANSPWRKRLWQEISRRLLQQKEGHSLRKALAKSEIDRLGIPVAGKVEVVQYLAADKIPGQKTLTEIKLTTGKHESVKIHKRYFQKPKSYAMISTFQSSERVVASVKGGSKDEAVDLMQLLRWFRPFGLGL